MRLTLAIFAVLLFTASAVCARPLRIVAFGDSATYGWLVPRRKAYPAQLQKALRAKGYDVTVKNEGVPGGTTSGALRHLDDAIGPDTDITLVEFGTNDLRRHVPSKHLRANLRAIIRILKQRGIAVMVIGLGSLNLSDVARAMHVPYTQWKLPPGRYRARDHAHFNAQGCSIVIAHMLPQIENMMKRISTQ